MSVVDSGDGCAEDPLKVFRGKRDDALDWPPEWCYSAKNALKSPAVDEFRKVIAEAEKRRAKTP